MMPTVQILLSDQRLPVGRKVTALVRVARPAKTDVVDRDTREAVAVLDRVGQLPLKFELSSGTWCVFVKTAYFPETVRVFTITDSELEQTITLALGSQLSDQPRHYEVRADISHQYALFPRQLVPSRATAPMGTRTEKTGSAAKQPRSIFAVYDFEFRPAEASKRPLFADAESFDERMTYWVGDWCKRNTSDPAQVRMGRRVEGTNKSICVVDLTLDLSTKGRENDRRKTMLGIKFHDQTFSVVLPPIQLQRQHGETAPLHLEVSFLDEAIDCKSNSNRLLGVRLHTSDPNFDAVTQFLADGEMPNALKVWNSLAKTMLQDKYQDPVGGSAAGLVLVHAYLSRSIRLEDMGTWEHWMHNLCTDFDFISDGAIGDAWMKALHPADRETQIRNAKAGFELAVRRGFPIFTEAVRLLSRGAEWAYQEKGSADNLQAIRWLTDRVLPGNALTTIRHEDV